jgi:bifunctional non-homologous end joining protein LigD
MLPHLVDRPLTLQRFPQGIESPGFMQKNAGKGFPPYIRRINLPKVDGTVSYPAISDLEGLRYLVNQNTVTFHIPCFRASDLEHPDRLVFDLDPTEGDAEGARVGARAVKQLLSDWQISSWVMTSGSKGYHVVISLQPTVGFDQLSRFAQAVAYLLAHGQPDRLTVEFLKRERKGRVFIDWLRNQFGATGVCPYSLRPRPGAPIAMPIGWEELDESDPDRFRLPDIADRLTVDPWAEALPQDLAPAVAALEEELERARIELPSFDRFGR